MFLNEFRLVGDFIHALAILLLISNIIRTRSCYSVSGLTIILYTIVFSFRYLDLFVFYSNFTIYNRAYKIYYLISSYLLLLLVYVIFRKTRDQISKTFPIFGYFIIACLLAIGTYWLDKYHSSNEGLEFFWRCSIFLEIFAIIPQMNLIHKQGSIDKVMLYYIMMLGFYRAFYILNWFYRYQTEEIWEPIGFYSGCVQTLIYLVFFIHIYPRLNKQIKIAFVEEKIDPNPPSLVKTFV